MADCTGLHCYCGIPEIMSVYHFSCEKCKRKFHGECVKSGPASILKGDFLFRFKCETCGGGEEEFNRMRLQWLHVVQLTLYNLQLAGSGLRGYFRWKEHICTFIDSHWTTFFGSQRKKTSLWHGTVAGVLSQGCPAVFISGANELKESGWWRLKELQPPSPLKQATPVSKPATKRKEISPSPTDAPKEGLRSRRGKTSIQAAMELKAKRSTLTEAKDIRKTKLAKSQAGTVLGSHGNAFASLSEQAQSEWATENQSATHTHSKTGINVKQSIYHAQTRSVVENQSAAHAQSKSGTNAKQSKSAIDDQSTHYFTSEPGLEMNQSTDMQYSVASTDHVQKTTRSEKLLAFTGLFSKSDSSQNIATGSMLTESQSGGPVPATSWSMVSPRSGSLADCSDESSNISQSSYLTEKDLQFQATVPNLLLSEDATGQDGDDSDLEIDPGTISPPGSPLNMHNSPTVQEMLSAIEDSSYLDNSNHDYSCAESVSLDTSNPDSMYSSSNQANFSFFRTISRNSGQGETGATRSVVDSESDSASSSSEGEDTQLDERASNTDPKRKKRKFESESQNTSLIVPQNKYQLMSSFEERLLLKKLEMASESCVLPPHINRFKRKLKVRQLKRDHGVPQFDLDAEMNKLSQRCYGLNMDRLAHNPGSCYHGDMRILDKFQTNTSNISKTQLYQQPSFLNRLVGYEDDQLHNVCSPYTARILKPFIRRDYESRPLKMRLLAEIKAYPHRNDPTWKAEPPAPIDFCYVRPQHIASVNALCRECFWPGIDVSECLQYPDFSCVALYRKIVIGFAFMVPDVKQNEAYISFIFAHPEWRRAQMATFMLYHLIQTCMGKDVTLHCSATNSAMLLYQKFGFKPEEFILDFYDKYYPADTTQCKNAFLLRLRR